MMRRRYGRRQWTTQHIELTLLSSIKGSILFFYIIMHEWASGSDWGVNANASSFISALLMSLSYPLKLYTRASTQMRLGMSSITFRLAASWGSAGEKEWRRGRYWSNTFCQEHRSCSCRLSITVWEKKNLLVTVRSEAFDKALSVIHIVWGTEATPCWKDASGYRFRGSW